MKKWTAKDLEKRVTLGQDISSDLKVETPKIRVWLSRCTVLDGEPYDNKITIEELINGKWKITDEYEG